MPGEEEHVLKQKKITIGAPRPGDDELIGKMHLQAWHETYRDDDAGITPEVIEELRGHITNEDGNAHRRNIFAESIVYPGKVLYKVARSGDVVVGFLHGTIHEDRNDLDAIYLLNAAKGGGTGDSLMNEFLAWADKDKPCQLEVFASNERAQKFYEKYGFKKADAPSQLFRGKIPFIIMVRPAEITDKPASVE